MEKTPNALRKHVVILGRTNAGKSTLFNALTEQNRAIVSAAAGTTTDPVSAAMELIPYGPIVLTDTAGTGDESLLGAQRLAKTQAACRKADAALYVQAGAAAGMMEMLEYEAFRATKLEHLLVFTQCDAGMRAALRGQYAEALFFNDAADLPAVREALAAVLAKQSPENTSLLEGFVPRGGHVVLVTPIDSEAPKGRLILPQTQTLRDALDNGFTCTVCRETELAAALANVKRVDLVVTDSQAFAEVDRIVPREVPLTSFSMLLARQKADFAQLRAGVEAVAGLADGSRILMLEGCTHNHTHEDIGRVKIPALLRKKTGKEFAFEYASGYDFPADLSGYALAVQCGGCMLNKRELTTRLEKMAAVGLPVTNYGILLAYLSGVLERSCEVFE